MPDVGRLCNPWDLIAGREIFTEETGCLCPGPE